MEGDVDILEREVAASTTRWMKVCARDTGGVMSSGGDETVTPIVVINFSRQAMASSIMVVDDDTDTKDGGTSLSRIKMARKRFVTAIN